MAMHQLKRIRRGNVIAQAAQEIRRLVIANGMPEGAKLPSEHALCDRLGVSRSSVREALRVLEAVGLVEKAQGKGVFVRRNRPAYVPQHHRPEAIQEAGPIALQMRMVLEPCCAELAAARAGTHEVRSLAAELQKFRDALASKSLEDAVVADSRFHMLLARASHNEILYDIMQALDPVATENRRRALAIYNDRRLIRLHAAIFEAVRRRAPAAARRAMERHMRAIKNVETMLAKG
jgi:GntR family transcriptional repressor for pyruvate dehydrogenase complex